MKIRKIKFKRNTLPKSPTSIQGLDEITGGGLPKIDQHWYAAVQAAENTFSHGVSSSRGDSIQ